MEASAQGKKCIIKTCNKTVNYRGHHIKTKGAGGSNRSYNIMPLCSDHHNMTKVSIHNMGTITFALVFPEVREWLVNNGWEQNKITKKWYHPREEK